MEGNETYYIELAIPEHTDESNEVSSLDVRLYIGKTREFWTVQKYLILVQWELSPQTEMVTLLPFHTHTKLR